MATIKIVLYTSKKLADGRSPIMVQITHKSKVRRISTGYNAFPEEWDENRCRPNKKHPNYKYLDNFLNKKEAEAKDELIKLDESKVAYSADIIQNKVKNELDSITFYIYTQGIIDELFKAGKTGNAVNYRTMLSVVKRFTNDRDFFFTQIDYKWLKTFETWHLEKGHTYNGLSVYLRALRAIYNRAIKEKRLNKDLYPFIDYKIREEKTVKRAIKKDLINQIKEVEVPEYTGLWHSKNYFLFSFYTRGMNFTDIAHLKKENLTDGVIIYRRQKTGSLLKIGINEQIQQIIDLYYDDKVEYIFPIIKRTDNLEIIRKDVQNGTKTYNKHLKRLGILCRIDRKLTGYVARHSWASIAKSKGFSDSMIGEGLGHSDLASLKVYLDDLDSSELDKINESITL